MKIEDREKAVGNKSGIIEDLYSSLQEQQNEVLRLEKRLGNEEKRVTNLNIKVEQIRGNKCNDVKILEEKLRDVSEELSHALDLASVRKNELDKQIILNTEKNRLFETEKSELSNEILKLQNSMSERQPKQILDDSESSSLRKQLHEMEYVNSSQKKIIAKITKKVEKLNVKISTNILKYDAAVNNTIDRIVQSRLNKISSFIVQIREKIKKIRGRAGESINSQVEEFNRVLQERDTTIESLKSEIEALYKDSSESLLISDFKSSIIFTNPEQNTALANEIAILKAKNARLKSRADDLEQALNQVRKTGESSLQKIAELNAEIACLKQGSDSSNSQNNKLKTSLLKEKELRLEVEIKAEENELKSSQLLESLQNIKSLNLKQKETIKELNMRDSNNQTKLHELSIEVRNCRRKNEELIGEIKQTQKSASFWKSKMQNLEKIDFTLTQERVSKSNIFEVELSELSRSRDEQAVEIRYLQEQNSQLNYKSKALQSLIKRVHSRLEINKENFQRINHNLLKERREILESLSKFANLMSSLSNLISNKFKEQNSKNKDKISILESQINLSNSEVQKVSSKSQIELFTLQNTLKEKAEESRRISKDFEEYKMHAESSIKDLMSSITGMQTL